MFSTATTTAETLNYDYNSKDNKERFVEDKTNYINTNLDHEQWSHRLDEDLFGKFLDFYNQAIEYNEY